ncbi:MAG: thioesterase family protein [Actinomycetota bacterium]|nr:thioesterase family protein [Actinomycetota bacterium]
MTVDPDVRVHSLHAYFIRRGDAAEPIRFEVDRLRDGRSFTTRAVVARQAGGAILNMSASFQRSGPTEQVQTATPPDVAGPEGLERDGWTPIIERSLLPVEPGRSAAWMRIPGLDDDPVLGACALAYLSDDLATDAVSSLHGRETGEGPEAWIGISLDHAIWFQGPLVASDWQLHHFRADALLAPRGLAVGHIFDRSGNHRATVSQEVLLRRAG